MLTTAAKILVVGGIANLFAGIVTGGLMSQIRMTAPTVPRALTLAHMAGYMQAPILFGLVFAVELSDLSGGVENLAAALLVAGTLMLVLKDVLNWRMEVGDEFQERPIGYHLGVAQTIAQVVGLVILTVGVLGNL